MLHLKAMKVRTPEEAGALGADLFEEAILAEPACMLGLATGFTPIPLYKGLIRPQNSRCERKRRAL